MLIQQDKIMEKINLKYLENLEHSWDNNIMENTQNRTEIVIEPTTRYFTFTRDFSKAMECHHRRC